MPEVDMEGLLFAEPSLTDIKAAFDKGADQVVTAKGNLTMADIKVRKKGSKRPMVSATHLCSMCHELGIPGPNAANIANPRRMFVPTLTYASCVAIIREGIVNVKIGFLDNLIEAFDTNKNEKGKITPEKIRQALLMSSDLRDEDMELSALPEDPINFEKFVAFAMENGVAKVEVGRRRSSTTLTSTKVVKKKAAEAKNDVMANIDHGAAVMNRVLAGKHRKAQERMTALIKMPTHEIKPRVKKVVPTKPRVSVQDKAAAVAADMAAAATPKGEPDEEGEDGAQKKKGNFPTLEDIYGKREKVVANVLTVSTAPKPEPEPEPEPEDPFLLRKTPVAPKLAAAKPRERPEGMEIVYGDDGEPLPWEREGEISVLKKMELGDLREDGGIRFGHLSTFGTVTNKKQNGTIGKAERKLATHQGKTVDTNYKTELEIQQEKKQQQWARARQIEAAKRYEQVGVGRDDWLYK